MDPTPILDTLEDLQVDPKGAKPNKMLWVLVGIAVVVIVAVFCLMWFRKSKKKCVVPYGYLRVKSNGLYLNIGPRVFPQHDSNLAVTLARSKTPSSLWRFENGEWRTDVDGQVYTFKAGPPGLGSTWGLVWLAPLNSSGQSVQFRAVDNLQAMRDVYPDGRQNIVYSAESGHHIWTQDAGVKFQVEVVNKKQI